jgi:hypothetical protein
MDGSWLAVGNSFFKETCLTSIQHILFDTDSDKILATSNQIFPENKGARVLDECISIYIGQKVL